VDFNIVALLAGAGVPYCQSYRVSTGGNFLVSCASRSYGGGPVWSVHVTDLLAVAPLTLFWFT
jgi:hypothetical protein